MIASRSMRIAPRTDCSASRLWGGRRSIIGLPWSRAVVTPDCHGREACGEARYRRRILASPSGPWTWQAALWTACGRPPERSDPDREQLPATDGHDEAAQARIGEGPVPEARERSLVGGQVVCHEEALRAQSPDGRLEHPLVQVLLGVEEHEVDGP